MLFGNEQRIVSGATRIQDDRPASRVVPPSWWLKTLEPSAGKAGLGLADRRIEK